MAETKAHNAESVVEEEHETDPSDKADKAQEVSEIEWEKLDEEALCKAAASLLKDEPISRIGKRFEQIRKAIEARLSQDYEKRRKAFEAAGGEGIHFAYTNPWKARFQSLLNEYREKKDQFYEQRAHELEKNLKLREQLIEALKQLYQETKDTDANLEKFKEIQKRWKKAGGIPHQHANRIFKTYYHHLENFYGYLNLNKGLREKDFEHNLAEKEKIIARAKALLSEPNVSKAFNELQYLHKVWKEKIGPVGREHREAVWLRFKEATRKIHDRKREYLQERNEQQHENLEKKRALLTRLEALAAEIPDKHTAWQENRSTLKALREEFIALGEVPRANRRAVWDAFQRVCRSFHKNREAFYSALKVQQEGNLKAKLELIRRAAENREREDWSEAVALFKEIQRQWKEVGHVPRQKVEEIWAVFKSHCDYFFTRYQNRGKAPEALGLDESLLKLKRYQSAMAGLVDDKNKLSQEIKFVRRKINDLERELQQLENNISFFSGDSAGNPLVEQARSNIKSLRGEIASWRQKLNFLISISSSKDHA